MRQKNASCSDFCGNTCHSDATHLRNTANVHPFDCSCCSISGLPYCDFLYFAKGNAKDTALQKKIENWRKVRRGQLRSNADNDDMFDAGGVMQDLQLSLEEGEQFFEENHEIEKLEIQISLWNRIGDAFKHLLNSCVILVCLLALSSFVAFAYSYVCRLWR